MGVFIYKRQHILDAVYNIVCHHNDGKLYQAKIVKIACEELKVSATVIQKALCRLYTTGYLNHIPAERNIVYIEPTYR